MRQGVIRLSRALYAVIAIIVLLISTLAVAMYLLNRPSGSSFSIYDVSFKLGEDKRSIELHVRVERGSIELDHLSVNNTVVRSWSADKHTVKEGEETTCVLEYHWRMGRDYVIKLVTANRQTAEVTTTTPETAPTLSVNITNVNVNSSSGFLNVTAEYEANGDGVDTLHMVLFTYSSFENWSDNVYIFYDPDYMANESINRADAIVRYFDSYGVPIYKIDYNALEILSGAKGSPARRCMLIVVNPLKDKSGRKLYDAMPAPLVDPNGNGIVRDDSKYRKSFLYDWMADEGLILVTVGALQPHKRILYSDGVYGFASDATAPFDAHRFLTNASREESIINGGFTLGGYTPVRASDTLGLSYRDELFGFDKDAMERYYLQYYAYGDYRLPYEQGNLNLTLPVFIRVHEGGWLAMGDRGFYLGDEQFAHDLFMVYMQGVWNSEWIPYGWYWDSGCTFHNCCGTLLANGTLETELVPSDIVGGGLVVRVVAIAYSSDLDSGIVLEQTTWCWIPEVVTIEVAAVE
jgi:hypothetical protein